MELLRSLTHEVERPQGMWWSDGELSAISDAVSQCGALQHVQSAQHRQQHQRGQRKEEEGQQEESDTHASAWAKGTRKWLTVLIAHADASGEPGRCAGAFALLSVTLPLLGEDHAAWAGEQVPPRVLRVLKNSSHTVLVMRAVQCGTALVERLSAQGKQGPLKKLLATSSFIPSLVNSLAPLFAHPQLGSVAATALLRCVAVAPAAVAQKGDLVRQAAPAALWTGGDVDRASRLYLALTWMENDWSGMVGRCWASLNRVVAVWLGGDNAAAGDESVLAGMPASPSVGHYALLCGVTTVILRASGRGGSAAGSSVVLATHTAVMHFVRVLSGPSRSRAPLHVSWALVQHALVMFQSVARLFGTALLLHHSTVMETLTTCLQWAHGECPAALPALAAAYATHYVHHVPVGHLEGPFFAAIAPLCANHPHLLQSLAEHRSGLWGSLPVATRTALEAGLCQAALGGDVQAANACAALVQSIPWLGLPAVALIASPRCPTPALALRMRPPAPLWPAVRNVGSKVGGGGGGGGSDIVHGGLGASASTSVFADYQPSASIGSASLKRPSVDAMDSSPAERHHQQQDHRQQQQQQQQQFKAARVEATSWDAPPSGHVEGGTAYFGSNVENYDDDDDDDDGDDDEEDQRVIIVNEESSESK